MHISIKNNDRAGAMSAHYNLLTYLGNTRSIFISADDDRKSSSHVSLICFSHIFFSRSDAGNSSEADKFHNEAADMIEPYKPLLAQIVEKTLGNNNCMNDEVLDNLIQTSEILKELFAISVSMENEDIAGIMSVQYNLLTDLANAR